MTLKEVLRAIPAMERDGVSKVARGKQESTQTREGFVEAYIATNGSINAMTKRLTGRNNHESWSDRRDQFVSRHLEQMRKGDTYNNGWLPNGEPTRRHLGLMAWAYTSSPKRTAKWLKTQSKDWKRYVSNPAQQLPLFGYQDLDRYTNLPKDVVDQIVFAVINKKEKIKSSFVGSKERPRNQAVYLAIKEKYLKVDDVIYYALSDSYVWFVSPTRKGLDLVELRRDKQAEEHSQLSLFTNPTKAMNVPVHMISSAGIHEKVGEIKLSDTPQGLRIDTDLYNIPSGYHGTHIHEFGSLLPSTKGSKKIAGGKAGSHYDPLGAGFHGSPEGDGHRGDLPKIHADEEGESRQTLYAPRLTLEEIKGRSIILHRYGDNYSDHPLPNGGGKERMAGGIIVDVCPHCKKNPIVRDGKGRKVPSKYIKGYKGKDREKRIKEIEKRRNEYEIAYKKYGDEKNFPQKLLDRIYRPFVTDKYSEPKESLYTKEAHDRGFFGTWKEKAKIASRYYKGKIDPNILHDVYRRGVGAWPTGHRGGATAPQWGNGRVNSFLVGGKAFFTSDNDLAEQLPDGVYNKIKEQRTWKEK